MPVSTRQSTSPVIKSSAALAPPATRHSRTRDDHEPPSAAIADRTFFARAIVCKRSIAAPPREGDTIT